MEEVIKTIAAYQQGIILLRRIGAEFLAQALENQFEKFLKEFELEK